MIPALAPLPHYVGPQAFHDQIFAAGLTTGLVTQIDASEALSYPGSGQAVLDRSGNSYDFTRGANSGSEPTLDPTFVGTPGGQSANEYFRSPDHAYFLGSPVTTFSDSLHKDNALYSWAGWLRISQVDLTNSSGIFRTADGTTSKPYIGNGLANTASGFPGKFAVQVIVTVSPAVLALTLNTGITGVVGSFAYYAFSHDEATGAWAAQVNGAQASGNATYASPSAASSGSGIQLGANNDPSGGYSGDTACFAMWNRALSAAELMALYNQSKAKFGL